MVFWAGVEPPLVGVEFPPVRMELALVEGVPPIRVDVSPVRVEFLPVSVVSAPVSVDVVEGPFPDFALEYSTPVSVEEAVEFAEREAFSAEIAVLVSTGLARVDAPAGFAAVFLSSAMWRTTGAFFLLRRSR